MIILGAGGHSIEVLDILIKKYSENDIIFFDNTIESKDWMFKKHPIFSDFKNISRKHTQFILGVGNIQLRKKLSEIALDNNYKWVGIRSKLSIIGHNRTSINSTVDIMDNVMISSCVTIGKGTLLNRNVNIHHNVSIGEFCVLSPSCQILGNVKIGKNVFIGAGAIILPNIKISKNATIGAGAVVTKNIEENLTVFGNPAK